MENLVSLNLVLVLIAGSGVTALTSLLNKKFKKLRARYIVVGLAIIAGLIYQGYITLVPMESQEFLLDFMVQVAAVSVLVYEFLWKSFTKDESKKLDKIHKVI